MLVGRKQKTHFGFVKIILININETENQKHTMNIKPKSVHYYQVSIYLFTHFEEVKEEKQNTYR